MTGTPDQLSCFSSFMSSSSVSLKCRNLCSLDSYVSCGGDLTACGLPGGPERLGGLAEPLPAAPLAPPPLRCDSSTLHAADNETTGEMSAEACVVAGPLWGRAAASSSSSHASRTDSWKSRNEEAAMGARGDGRPGSAPPPARQNERAPPSPSPAAPPPAASAPPSMRRPSPAVPLPLRPLPRALRRRRSLRPPFDRYRSSRGGFFVRFRPRRA